MSLRVPLLYLSVVLAAAACSANSVTPGSINDESGGSSGHSAGGTGNGSGNSGGSGAKGGTGHITPPMPGANCGNNQHDDGEECDDGNTTGNDGCTAGCQVETDWSCPPV